MLRPYATKGRPARSCIAAGRPDKQTGTSRNCTAPRSDQRRQWSCAWGGRCGCNRECGRPVFAPPPIPEMTRPTRPPAHRRARMHKKRRHPGRRPESSPNRQNSHFRHGRRSKNATASVLSDFLRGSGTGDLAIRSDRHARPSQRRRGIRHCRQVKPSVEAYAGPVSKP